jgi:hypothetical protein
MSMIERGNGQRPHLFNRARISEFERTGTSSSTIQLLVHWYVTMLAATDNFIFRIRLYILLKLTMILSLCAVMNV